MMTNIFNLWSFIFVSWGFYLCFFGVIFVCFGFFLNIFCIGSTLGNYLIKHYARISIVSISTGTIIGLSCILLAVADLKT